jgi:hypothetical protein
VKEFNGDTRLLVHRHLRVKVLQSLQNDDEQHTFTSAPSLDQVRSIAILPFQPLDPIFRMMFSASALAMR